MVIGGVFNGHAAEGNKNRDGNVVTSVMGRLKEDFEELISEEDARRSGCCRAGSSKDCKG